MSKKKITSPAAEPPEGDRPPREMEVVPAEYADAPPGAMVPVQPQPPAIFGNDPAQVLAKASDVARLLVPIILSQNLFKTIGGKKYVFCEGWTSMGAMLGVFPKLEWSRRVPHESLCIYEARVGLVHMGSGREIGAAEALCSSAEQQIDRSTGELKDRWNDEYAIKSMAQTRAVAKAFRMAFSWVMVMAGYSPTPAEEMSEGMGTTDEEGTPKPKEEETPKPKCPECGKAMYVFDDATVCWKKRGGCGFRMSKQEDAAPAAQQQQMPLPDPEPKKRATQKNPQFRGAAGGPPEPTPPPAAVMKDWVPPKEWVQYIELLVADGKKHKVRGITDKIIERLAQPDHLNEQDWWEMTKYIWEKFRAANVEPNVTTPECVVSVGINDLMK